MPYLARLQAGWQTWQQQYLAKHLPAHYAVQLRQAHIFVVPTLWGLSWLGLSVLCFVIGTNYQNNLVLLLSGWLFGVWLISALLGFFNLYRCHLSAEEHIDALALQPWFFELQCSKPISGVRIWSPWAGSLQVDATKQGVLKLTVNPCQRQAKALGRLRVSSLYPLALFDCRSYPDFATEVWLYPAPMLQPTLPQANALQQQGTDVDQLREFRLGDPPQRIDWRRRLSPPYPWLVREFSEQTSPLMLQAPVCTEALASHFAALIDQAMAEGQPVGLTLSSLRLEPQRGPEHRQQLMRALAAWR